MQHIDKTKVKIKPSAKSRRGFCVKPYKNYRVIPNLLKISGVKKVVTNLFKST